VVVENQGFGSLTAAPIAMEVMAEALNNNHEFYLGDFTFFIDNIKGI